LLDDGHGKQFLSRMERAAVRAEQLSRSDLAKQIRDEIQKYLNGEPITAADIYERIDDVIAGDPAVTDMQVADLLGDQYGLTRKEFLAKFKRFPEEFAKQQREAGLSSPANES